MDLKIFFYMLVLVRLAYCDMILWVLWQIFSNRIIQTLDEASGSIDLLRDNDRLVAYRLPKDNETSPLVVFMHEQRLVVHT